MEQKRRMTQKVIRNKLNDPLILYYSQFLEHSLNHNGKYIRLFEKENHDITKVYSDLKEFCSYYINRVTRFDSISNSVEEILKSMRDKTFEDLHLIADHDYEMEFLSNFNFDFDGIDKDAVNTFLNNTKDYYLCVLKEFNSHVRLEEPIFVHLEVLDVCNQKHKCLSSWEKFAL